MARNYANIITAIWGDPEWRALDERSQRLYLLLATQKNISAAGMLPLTVGRWAGMAEDSTPDKIRASLRRLAADRFVAIDEAHEELLVRSFVRHDNGYGNKKRRMVIESAAGEIESRVLRQVLAVELVRLGLPAEWTRESPVELPGEACAGLSDGLAEVTAGGGTTPDSTPVDNPVDNAFPQVDRLYQNQGRPIPAEGTSDRVVVTEEVVVRTSTLNPQPAPPPPPAIVAPGWLAADPPAADKKMTLPNAPHTGRQSGLFAATNVKLSDRQQIILDSLRLNGYQDATQDDAKAVDRLARKVWPGKGVGYLRGVANGTGFGTLFEQMRQERAKVVEAQIRRLEQTEPACMHGTLAGNALHPTHGTMLCPQCRGGVPVADEGPTTAPEVSAALNAYRRDYTGALTTVDLIQLTQQATALHAAGATASQLTDLAHTAATQGVGLLTAATGRTPSARS